MAEWLMAGLLGVVQGLTEFLPISSSGHLVLAHHLFGFRAGDLFFDVMLHLATLLAVVAVFGRDLLGVVRNAVTDSADRIEARRLLLWIVLGSIPAAIVGLAFKDQIEALFLSTTAVGVALMVTGLILLLPRLFHLKGEKSVGELRWFEVIGIGVMQALAIVPGISRSGSTISTGLLCHCSGQQAARFSFFLFMPAVFGAALLEGFDAVEQGGVGFDLPLLIGFVTALVTGYIALRWLLALLRKGQFHRFGYYCLVVGLAALLFM